MLTSADVMKKPQLCLETLGFDAPVELTVDWKLPLVDVDISVFLLGPFQINWELISTKKSN